MAQQGWSCPGATPFPGVAGGRKQERGVGNLVRWTWGRGGAWAAAGAGVKTPEFPDAWAFRKHPHFTGETADQLGLRIRDPIERTRAAFAVPGQ